MSFPKSARSGVSLALVALAGLCLCAPRRAGAEAGADKTSLQPDLTVEQQWNSNIFAAESDEEHSLVTIVRPSLTFLNEGELGYLRLNGWLSNHTYWEESELNGADRGGSLRFDRKLSPRFAVFGDGSLVRYTDLDEIRSDPGPSGQEGVLISSGAPDIDVSQASGGLRYDLDARTRMELTGGPFSVSYNRHPVGATTYRDRSGWYTNWNLAHALTQRDKLSIDLGASVTDQDSVVVGYPDQNEGLVAPASPVAFDTGKSRSQQQNLTVGWQREWSHLWLTDVSVGVRRLDSSIRGASSTASTAVTTIVRDDGSPVVAFAPTKTFIPTDSDDTSPAVIGSVTLRRMFERSLLTFQYSRETEVASGALSSDVDVDTFMLDFRHKLSERFTFGLTGEFAYYTSVNDSPQLVGAYFTPVPVTDWDPTAKPAWTCGGLLGPGGSLQVTGTGGGSYGQCEIGTSSELTGQRLTLNARVDWQMRKRLASFVVFRYYDQQADPGLWGSDYNKYTIGVGFNYAWDLEL